MEEDSDMKKSKKQANLSQNLNHIFPCLLILSVLIILSGCIDLGNLIDLRTPAQKAAQAIDDVLVTADFNSAQWRAEVDKLATQLDKIESNAAQDVRDILAKTVATTGTEIRCNVDFIHERTRQDLQRLSDTLRGKPTTPPLPTFCQVVPTGVDMNHRPNFVEFYGYDFKLRQRDSNSPGGYNETKRVNAFLTSDGGEVPLDSWIDVPTHYLLTVKTSQSDTIPICNKENRHIVLRSYDGIELSSIGVAKFTCPTAPPAPSPQPEKSFYTVSDSYGWSFPDPLGHTTNREYGGACSAGYHRSRYMVTAESISGGAGCYFDHWVSNDEYMCKINVRFWYDVGGSVKCNINIFQAGDVPPTPPTPPCPCW